MIPALSAVPAAAHSSRELTMLRPRSLCLLALLLLSASGCQSASKAAHGTAEAMSSSYAAAMEAGRALADLMPGGGPQNPGQARERMLLQAGQNRFRNEQLTQARDRLTPQSTAFSEAKESLRFDRFEESREGFRRAEAPGFTGSLGKALGVGVSSGLRVTRRAVQPVLGGVLPGFERPTSQSGRNRPD